jgi:hypothetical protein
LLSVSTSVWTTTASPATLRNYVGQSTEVGTVFSIGWRFHNGAEEYEVVELDIVRPNELGSCEVMFKEWLLRPDDFLCVFFGVRPVAVIEVDGEPVLGEWNVLDSRVLRVSVNWSP